MPRDHTVDWPELAQTVSKRFIETLKSSHPVAGVSEMKRFVQGDNRTQSFPIHGFSVSFILRNIGLHFFQPTSLRAGQNAKIHRRVPEALRFAAVQPV